MIFIAYAQLSTVYCRFMHMVIRLFSILIILLVVAACSHHQTAPISSRQPPTVTKVDTHRVQVGETLYSIAWQYSLDYRYLASLNGINSNYLIYPGQQLRLKPPKDATIKKPIPTTATQKTQAKPIIAPPPKTQPKAQAPRVNKPPTTVVKRSDKSPVSTKPVLPKTNTFSTPNWQWPAQGKVLTNFYAKNNETKGIDIAGKKGESVLAAANGKIVYAGNGIRGYGNLVIIRHNAQYLSAYAHNHRINVKEGEQVTGGQRIAELGSTGTGAKNRTVLHFQVRKSGKPIDPLTVLPKRNF